jgi:catechol 2,3-dioxygenase-like lactoylglutathione lyase family enzyme
MLFDHIDLRVRNLAAARPLYDALLPAMGCSRINADEESAGYHRPAETGGEPFLWLVEERDHRPNGTRIALAAGSRADVDHLAAIAQAAGARAFEPPALQAEYGPNYYATFFEDADGNKIEICCRRPE